MKVNVEKAVQGSSKFAPVEIDCNIRGTRIFKRENGTVTAVQFGRKYRLLGVRVDVHAADPETPLIDADRYLFICNDPPEEIVLDVAKSKLLPMLKGREVRVDQYGKSYVSLKD